MRKIQWEKDFGPHQAGDRDYIILAIIALITIGIFYNEAILYVVIGVLITYVLINSFYNRRVGRKLYLPPKRETVRLFQGDEAALTFEFENKSRLPYIHGQLRFQITPIIKALDGDITSSERAFAFYKTFSIRAKGKTIINFPFQAERRGVTQVRNLSYSFPHLFNFNVLTLKYLPYERREIVVFPKPKEVKNVDIAYQLSPGEQRVNLSPFEDIQSPISTRDYEYGDPFYKINWKASAKTGELQSNMYEQVVEASYLFLVNIRQAGDGVQLNEEMEDLLSYTTYLCNKAFEQEVNYEMYINARTASNIPFLKLPEGEGRSHYIHSLEMLARIPRHSMTYPFAEMIYRVKRQIQSQKTIIIVGDTTEEVDYLLRDWSKRQRDIYQVVAYESGAVMEAWKRDVNVHA